MDTTNAEAGPSTQPQHPPEDDGSSVDPVWTTSRTARQIYYLCNVEKKITVLLQRASNAMICLSLPQTDGPDDKLIVQPDAPHADEPAEDGLPRDVLRKDEMRNEQLAAEIQSYFDVLLEISHEIRSSLAHIRHARMTPSSIIAPDAISPPKAPGQPPQPFTPPAFGVGLPYDEDDAKRRNERGLQEARIERDAWKGILDALMKLKKARDEERAGQGEDAAKTDEEEKAESPGKEDAMQV
ncbi:hypothetical protein EV714DRAFT_207602 [Schizophyllum commune]